MNRTESNTLGAALVAALICVVLVLAGSFDDPTATVTEDSPGWECDTMGNGICGPVTLTADGRVASPNMAPTPVEVTNLPSDPNLGLAPCEGGDHGGPVFANVWPGGGQVLAADACVLANL
jgi:hypothetical protein